MGEKKIIPQPPLRRGREDELLVETPPELAVVLWQYVRHLRDWIRAVDGERQVLFNPAPPRWVAEKWKAASEIVPELADELLEIESLLRSPLEVNPLPVACASERIARWAEAEGHRETALQFAELAAALDAAEPRRANLAGRLTRDAADFARAEVWLERGIGLARQKKDWVEYTRGHLGAGIMCMRLGREARARRHLNTASSIAMREGHEWLAAEAQHDLFHFMTVRGNYVDAEVHARRALRWYPKHHPRLPFFAADVAFLLVCGRHYSAAAGLLRRFVRVVRPPQNVLGFSLLVRALACAGREKEFESARMRVLDLLGRHAEYEAAARWNLAHAERAVGMWNAARSNARAAAELARAQRDAETEQLARKLLDEIEAGEPSPAEIQRTDTAFRELLHTLAARLAEWSPTRRGRSRSLSRSEWAA
jgi:tetratricopeptide (TPR) repeat protein